MLYSHIIDLLDSKCSFISELENTLEFYLFSFSTFCCTSDFPLAFSGLTIQGHTHTYALTHISYYTLHLTSKKFKTLKYLWKRPLSLCDDSLMPLKP